MPRQSRGRGNEERSGGEEDLEVQEARNNEMAERGRLIIKDISKNQFNIMKGLGVWASERSRSKMVSDPDDYLNKVMESKTQANPSQWHGTKCVS